MESYLVGDKNSPYALAVKKFVDEKAKVLQQEKEAKEAAEGRALDNARKPRHRVV